MRSSWPKNCPFQNAIIRKSSCYCQIKISTTHSSAQHKASCALHALRYVYNPKETPCWPCHASLKCRNVKQNRHVFSRCWFALHMRWRCICGSIKIHGRHCGQPKIGRPTSGTIENERPSIIPRRHWTFCSSRSICCKR